MAVAGRRRYGRRPPNDLVGAARSTVAERRPGTDERCGRKLAVFGREASVVVLSQMMMRLVFVRHITRRHPCWRLSTGNSISRRKCCRWCYDNGDVVRTLKLFEIVFRVIFVCHVLIDFSAAVLNDVATASSRVHRTSRWCTLLIFTATFCRGCSRQLMIAGRTS